MAHTKIADYLRNLSIHLIQSLNNRTFHIVAPMYMVPDFSGDHLMDQTDWTTSNREEVISLMGQFFETNPNFSTEILDISVDVNPECEAAKVWIRRTDAGLAEGPTRETLMRLAWQLRDGEWVCVGYQGVRSFPFYGGLDGSIIGAT